MPRYKNVITGAIVEIRGEILGDGWELIDTPSQKPVPKPVEKEPTPIISKTKKGKK
ncbi:MAG: hypothetical protein J6D29_04795 [Solobacterium sp.]|nr:hypothetical protein [Solobacterium sp.]